MKKKEILYIAIITLLSIALLTNFITASFHLSLGDFGEITHHITSPVALGIGIVFALLFGKVFPDFNKTMSKKMLQYSVIGLGFGMNVNKALASGSEGGYWVANY